MGVWVLIGGLGWWFGILEVPLSNNPFHKGILGIQTTDQICCWNNLTLLLDGEFAFIKVVNYMYQYTNTLVYLGA